MATYKVLQDVEAEDKLVGALTLRQFIYAGIAALSIYLGFLAASKGAAFMLVVFVPIAGICGFFAFPWGKDQPTEVWALARIRFLVKPRKRIWDQSGAKELVSVTAPHVPERRLTNGLSRNEVQSRLSALANTIDSRGWAIKNVNVNLAAPATELPNLISDRLAQPSVLPQTTSLAADVTAADDMLDETANPVAHKFGNMITAADANHRQQIIAQLQMPNPSLPTPAQTAVPQPPAGNWFMQTGTPTVNTPTQAVFGSDPAAIPGAQPLPGTRAADPTADEKALIEKLKAENQKSGMSAAYGHMKTLKTPEQLAEEARQATTAVPAPKPSVTPHAQAAIINLANNDDLDVATIARQAQAQVGSDDGEVVIPLR